MTAISTTSGSAVAIRRALVVASSAWAAAIPAAAFTAAQSPPTAVAAAFALVVYAVGAVVCHQLPDRSFHLFGRQLPVCARCTGIYVGAAIAAIVGAVSRPRRTSRLSPLTLALLACIPTVGTLAFEWTTGVTPANWVRALAGAALGAPIAWLLVQSTNAP